MKDILRFPGKIFFYKYFKNLYKRALLKEKKSFSKYFYIEHSYISFYKKDKTSYLSALCDKYGTDKGSLNDVNQTSKWPWPPTTYADYYSRLFDHCRNNIRNVFECGIGTNNINLVSNMGINGTPGASLRVWKEYFPNATVIGADIDSNILFEEERISTYYIDQTNPETIKEMWNKINIDCFDLMIDDGLHTFDAAICLFENSISHLSDNGIYIIEDLDNQNLIKIFNYFKIKNYQIEVINLFKPNISLINNNLVVIRKIN